MYKASEYIGYIAYLTRDNLGLVDFESIKFVFEKTIQVEILSLIKIYMNQEKVH